MVCIKDINMDGTVEDAFLHSVLSENVVGTQTILYHQSKSKPDTAEEEAELPTESGDIESVEGILDNLMVQGLEVTYPEQSEEDVDVPVAIQ